MHAFASAAFLAFNDIDILSPTKLKWVRAGEVFSEDTAVTLAPCKLCT